MRLLLDSHVLIWTLSEKEQLSDEALSAVAEPRNEVWVSIVSFWEIAIKVGLGKMKLPGPMRTWLPEAIGNVGFRLASIDEMHAFAVSELPLHHRDPFDRMLIAQAMQTGLTLVTRDRQLAAYGVPILWT